MDWLEGSGITRLEDMKGRVRVSRKEEQVTALR